MDICWVHIHQCCTRRVPEPGRAVQGWIRGIFFHIYFGPLQFLKGNQSMGQRHFREPCSNMRDGPGWNTCKKKNNCAHTSRQDLGSEVRYWVFRIWWDAASPSLTQSLPQTIKHLCLSGGSLATVVSMWSYSFIIAGVAGWSWHTKFQFMFRHSPRNFEEIMAVL